MATVAEKYRGFSGDTSSRRIEYVIRDATDDVDALAALIAQAPQSYDGLPRENAEIEEVSKEQGIYLGRMLFSIPGGNQKGLGDEEFGTTDSVDFSFDFGLETAHRTSAYYTNYYLAPGAVDHDRDTIIGWASDKEEPQGVEVLQPTATWQITWFAPTAQVTDAYRQTVENLVGCVNSATFWGRPAGSVLFLGVSGRPRTNLDWELIYRFQYRENKTGQSYGDVTGVSVKGWDLVEVRTETPQPGGANKATVPKIVEVYVHEVYPRADLNQLALAHQVITQAYEPLETWPE